jgi:hypothetical protein
MTYTPSSNNCTTDLGGDPSSQPTTSNVEPKEQRFTNASPQGLAKLIPESQYFCGAVRTTGHNGSVKAAVTMAFPHQQFGGIHCLMSLSIIPSRLSNVALELFGKYLETDGGMQCVVDENGGKMVPHPYLTLHGALHNGMIKVLGGKISHAIEGCLQWKKENDASITRTSCVTLTISRNPEEDGLLNINLSFEGGLGLKNVLYPEKRV